MRSQRRPPPSLLRALPLLIGCGAPQTSPPQAPPPPPQAPPSPSAAGDITIQFRLFVQGEPARDRTIFFTAGIDFDYTLRCQSTGAVLVPTTHRTTCGGRLSMPWPQGVECPRGILDVDIDNVVHTFRRCHFSNCDGRGITTTQSVVQCFISCTQQPNFFESGGRCG